MAQYYTEIDGSMLEGGGQILRTSVSLSAIMGIPVKVVKIRANRSKPGLAAQHLVGLRLVADMCEGELIGGNIGSTEIKFKPGKVIKGGHYVADTRTAGSVSLLMQIALPCAYMADGPVTLDLKGGTNADMAPQVEYMTEVFRNAMKMFGAPFELRVNRRGYFPKGGGIVTVEVNPVTKFKPIQITERGYINAIFGWSFVAGTLPLRWATQMSDGVKEKICSVYPRTQITALKEDANVAPHNCSGIIVICETSTGCRLAADGLGKRGVDPLDLGRTVGLLLSEAILSGVCLDSHLQDQVILYMALADGRSAIRVGEITMHTKTVIYIVESLLKINFEVTQEDKMNLIQCDGIGVNNKNPPQTAPR
ncbi:unnamed protein product [Spodoptera littoralis]|uniref:RNA 3'-terminal phosphate cyclase n=1 Tax=Spodoptera littoralis TaxID=7109 RepID=A0A9P0I7Y3_SPOLI|nr:unnamed protein product [Spodoptera littoralis]CAH1640474.1 unnamed protein product [Spodoptera littoralis]